MNKNENEWIEFHQKAAEEALDEAQSNPKKSRKNKTYFKMRVNEAIQDKEFSTQQLYAIHGYSIEEILLSIVTMSNVGTTAQQKEACFERIMAIFKSCKPNDDRYQTDIY